MKKSRNGFVKNLHYICLIGVIALGLMTIVGTGGGGGGGGTSVSTDTGDTDQTDTDTGDGEETTPPEFTGFDFALAEGDFWEYGWDYYKNSWAQRSSGSTTRDSGTFRVTLGSTKEIDGVTAYGVQVTGRSGVSDKDFAPRWKYLAVNDNQILGSEDGTTLVVLFDAQEGVWPGTGYFTTITSTALLTAEYGQINNDYITESSVAVSQSASEEQCENFPGVGNICGDSSYSWTENGYYVEGIGPIGYYYYNSFSDCGGGFCSGATWTHNVGLIASSLRGDTVDYDLEAEPNDSPDAAQSVNLSVDIEGHCGDEDGGTPITLNETAEVEPNDHPQQTAQTLDQPTIINGDIQDDDTFTAIDFDYGGTNWPRAVEDWYTFTLTSDTTVNVELNHEGQLSTEIQLYLFNDTGTTSMGNILALDEPIDPTTTTRSITHSLNAGTYLIAIDAWDTDAVRVDYTLDFLGSRREVEDWYSLTLTAQATGTIALDVENSSADLDLYLYNAGATTLLGSSSAGGDQESITTTLDPGTYVVGVDAFNGSSSYTLTIQ